jgi:hypothetical protein
MLLLVYHHLGDSWKSAIVSKLKRPLFVASEMSGFIN